MARKSNAPRGKKGNSKHPAAGRKVSRADNEAPLSPDDDFQDKRERFLQHRKQIDHLLAKEAAAKALRVEAEKDAKAGGFAKKLFAIARDLTGTDKKAKKVKAEVVDRLTVARYIGDPLGKQLDLFADATAIERVDPYEEGEQASRDGKPAKPDHAPDTEAYIAWMAGYQTHQATLLKGFKPLVPDPDDWGDADRDPARPIA